MSEQSTAARIYAAYAAVINQRDGEDLPKFLDLPDKGAAWFAVANAKPSIVEPPTDVLEPRDYVLSKPIEGRRICDSVPTPDGETPDTTLILETIPEALHIRPLVAADLCVHEYEGGTASFDLAMRARVHGVEIDMLEWRVDAADAQVANYMMHDATGHDAGVRMQQAFEGAGGVREPDDTYAWREAALALVAEEHGDTYLVACRSPGLGTVKLGPIRVGHIKIYESTAVRSTEWGGRLAALAKAINRPLEQLQSARIEDVDRLWSCFQMLKKKVDETAMLMFGAQLSSRSTAGDQATSKTSPSQT